MEVRTVPDPSCSISAFLGVWGRREWRTELRENMGFDHISEEMIS